MIERLKTNDRRGFIAVLALILLIVLGIFGLSYWTYSRFSTDQIVKEAHRIKARALAQAGLEKVMINIMNQYRMGNYDLSYSPGITKDRIDEEYRKDFGDGFYRVDDVRPYTANNHDYVNQPYLKNNIPIGKYDIWKITVIGEIPQTSVRATVESLVKVIRLNVNY
ncbi:MAG: hypothetical protein HQM09_07610 [Candidatus Riflebacteria bacterium]|nr:hypothetical protein [Candidatus Riflebacteria bacterium]